METKYRCEICGTRPDQLSHHNSHLQTQKHRDNCDLFVKEMRIFSHTFKEVKPSRWYESEHKDFIIAKYLAETGQKEYTNESVHEWFRNVMFSEGNGRYGWEPKCFAGKFPQDCYEAETGLACGGLFDPAFKSWAIDKILKYKETACPKPLSRIATKEDQRHKMHLSRYTSVKFNKIKDVRYGLVDLRYLHEPDAATFSSSDDPELYTSDAMRFSCLLFDRFGIDSVHALYAGHCGPVDIEEHPEEKKYNSFYFYKDVEIEHTNRIANVKGFGGTTTEKRKVWLKCYMGDFMDCLLCDAVEPSERPEIQYEYMSNDDFRFFVKESLTEIFTEKIERLKRRIDELKTATFRGSWYTAFTPDTKIWRDHYNPDVYYFYDTHVYCAIGGATGTQLENRTTHEIVEIPAENYLTESQKNEYVAFLEKKETDIERMESDIEKHKTTLLKIQNLSLSSELMISIVNICQYLFEYNEELIEYYKTNDSYTNIARRKERMERELMEEET